jgi:hypothetical protein
MSPDIKIKRLSYEQAFSIVRHGEHAVGYRLHQTLASYLVYVDPNLGHKPVDEKLRRALSDDTRWTLSLTDAELNQAKPFIPQDLLQSLLK